MMDKVLHYCVDEEGYQHTTEIEFTDIEYDENCTICGDKLVSTKKVLAAIYEHLTEED